MGETVADPWSATAPIPGSRSSDAAFFDDHVSLAVAPGLMVIGLALRVALGAGAGAGAGTEADTETVAVTCTVPPLPVAVRV